MGKDSFADDRVLATRRLHTVLHGVEATLTFDRDHHGTACCVHSAARSTDGSGPAPFLITPEDDSVPQSRNTRTSRAMPEGQGRSS